MRRCISTLLLSFAFAAPLAAQNQPAQAANTPTTAKPDPEGYKSPSTATLISVVIPGGGSIYAGNTRKGATILGSAFGGVVLAAAGASQGNTGTTLAGLGLELGSWIYGIATAGGDARAHNSASGLASLRPIVQTLASGQTHIGVSLPLGR